MKAKFFLSALALPLLLCANTPAGKQVQCGVSNSQIINYLKGAPHYHTYVCCVTDIPGTCNSTATIENCGTATVYVQDGIIIGHADHGGICDP